MDLRGMGLSRGIREGYIARVLRMDLDSTAKIQIHVGGAYGNREAGVLRFEERSRPRRIQEGFRKGKVLLSVYSILVPGMQHEVG